MHCVLAMPPKMENKQNSYIDSNYFGEFTVEWTQSKAKVSMSDLLFSHLSLGSAAVSACFTHSSRQLMMAL